MSNPETASPIALRTKQSRVSAVSIASYTAGAIETGEYAPGARIREQELANKFQCSRAPVREALRILESMGMVVIEPMRGARVSLVDDTAFHEVYLLRRALGTVLARLAAETADHEARSALFADAQALLASVTQTPPPADEVFEEDVRNLGRRFRAMAGAARTDAMLQALTLGRIPLKSASFTTQERRLQVAQNWLQMAGAILAGDADAAEDVVRRQFDQALDFLRSTETGPP